MIVDGAIDVVAIEGQDDRCVSSGGGERLEIVLPVAFVNGLAQWNPGVRNDLRVDRCFHEYRSAGAGSKQRAQDGRNLDFERAAGLDVLGALNVGERLFTNNDPGIQKKEGKKHDYGVLYPAWIEFSNYGDRKLGHERKPEREGGK